MPSSWHCLRANGRCRARRIFGNIEEQQRGAPMAKAVELPFFIHGEALYGRATERELFIGGYCNWLYGYYIPECDIGDA